MFTTMQKRRFDARETLWLASTLERFIDFFLNEKATQAPISCQLDQAGQQLPVLSQFLNVFRNFVCFWILFTIKENFA